MSLYATGFIGKQALTEVETETLTQIYGCVSRFSELLHVLVSHCLHSDCETCKSLKTLCNCCGK